MSHLDKADAGTQTSVMPLELDYAQARATVAQLEYETTEYKCNIACYAFENAQQQKLIKELRAVTKDVPRGREEELSVQGRSISPAHVPSQHLTLPQVAQVTYLNVPFAEKELAKAHGAAYDWDLKKWFVPPLMDLAPFHRWNWGKKLTLQSEYFEKNEIKALGGKWDPGNKVWYVTDNMT